MDNWYDIQKMLYSIRAETGNQRTKRKAEWCIALAAEYIEELEEKNRALSAENRIRRDTSAEELRKITADSEANRKARNMARQSAVNLRAVVLRHCDEKDRARLWPFSWESEPRQG